MPDALFLDDPWLAAAGLGLIVVLIYGELFLHEFGHWIFAKLLGYRIVGFSTGMGPMVRERLDPEAGRFLRLRLWPVSGFVLPVKTETRETRLQSFLVYLAGPLFSALFGASLYLLLRYLEGHPIADPWDTLLRHSFMVCMVLVGISVLYNVFPRSLGGSANDGMGMLQALMGRGFPRDPYPLRQTRHAVMPHGLESGEPLLEPETSEPGRLGLQRFLYHCAITDWKAAGRELEEALENPAITAAERIALLDRFAELVIDHRIRGHAPRAIRAMAEATSLLPASEILRAKQALCLVVNSFYDDGRRAANFLLDETENDHIRACCTCVLATADAQQGRMDGAKALLKEAQSLHKRSALEAFAEFAIWGDRERPMGD